MDKEFDLNQVGKRMPYRVPEGFFESIQTTILERAAEERRRKKSYRIKAFVTAALAAAAILCGVLFLPTSGQEGEAGFTPDTRLVAEGHVDFMDDYVQQLTDEELQNWIEFSENDIYYELTTENEEYEND